MRAQEFIIEKLNSLINKFKTIKARYEYDITSKSHIIEITPNDIYHHDSTYIEWERKMMSEFLSEFGGENICFISDDDMMGIETETYSCQGADYNQNPITSLYNFSKEPYTIHKTSININIDIVDRTIPAVNMYTQQYNTTGIQTVTVQCSSMGNYYLAA